MTDYTKLVKELRGCKYIDYCKDCPRMAANGYVEICNIKDDAAAAIEALQAEVERLEPKRGKWVGVSPMVDTVQCSVCGGQLFSAELETPYCPYCGAKMEVQE